MEVTTFGLGAPLLMFSLGFGFSITGPLNCLGLVGGTAMLLGILAVTAAALG